MDQSSEGAPSASSTSAPTLGTDRAPSAAQRLFAGGGEIGAILADIDWAQTPLGPVETWPQTLRTSLRICLTSRHDIILWWGPDLRVFYNDAYAPTLGMHHPGAAGKPGREVWAEIWPTIGPMLEGVLHTGQPTWSYDELLYLERNGYPEETYHTFSYSPIEDDNGDVGGVFTAVTETTLRVLSERRAVAARDLGAAIVDARTPEEVCARAMRALAADPNDVPFALLYLPDAEGRRARLAASVGLPERSPFAPTYIGLGTPGTNTADPSDRSREARLDHQLPGGHAKSSTLPSGSEREYHWQLGDVLQSGQHEVVTDLPRWPGASSTPSMPSMGEGDALPPRAVVLPVTEPGQATPSAFLVAGVNPHRALDADYERFYELLASHLASALASAHAYEAERQRAEALAAIDRAKTAFFSNVSHEFRTPLTLMLGPLEDSLADAAEPLPPQQQQRQQLIYRNAVRLLKLVNTLLDFARFEAGRVQARYEPTNLSAYTAELASAFRSLVERAGMALIVDCPPLDGRLQAPVYVDREMWEKILLNLLSNAFKFTLEGEIRVTLHPVADGSAVELEVRDTGVGIPADELPRLFERFHRVEGARARTHEGSGIGLALVQELAQLHGGTIRAESVEGVGTAFVVTLPVGAAHLPPERLQAPSTLPSTALGAAAYVEEAGRWLPEPSSAWSTAPEPLPVESELAPAPLTPTDHRTSREASSERSTTRPARIVLADDNADMREYLRRLLSEQYSVEAVANGTQALAAIRRQIPDLVLSDVMMPDLDGFGLLRAVRGNAVTASLPVILLSARAGEEATVEGLAAGADDYLIKPFSAREVLSRVAARLEIERIRAEAQRRTREALDALLATARELVATDETADSQTVDVVAEHLAVLARRVLGCEIVSLVGIAANTGCFVPLATVGRASADEAAWYKTVSALGPEAYYDEEQLERLRLGKPIVVNVPAAVGQELPTYGTRATAVAPLSTGKRLMGILSIAYASGPHEYTADELELISGFAQMAQLVLQREQLLGEREAARAETLALTEATRRMDEFLGIASHELRTPLTSITANVQLVTRQLQHLNQLASEAEHGQPSRMERVKLLLERTGRQVGRLDRLVGDLLDVTRIEAGKLELRPDQCDLMLTVNEAVQEQRAVWPTRTVTLDMPRLAALPIHADADRIGQVVTNFLTNALKYSPPEQPVAVHLHTRDNSARVEVHDAGPGLTPEQQAHLFERFYRVPGIEQQSGSGIGLGLGLHICKTIIERHGGSIGVESRQGEGSAFWFTLPLASAENAELPEHSAHSGHFTSFTS